MSAGALLGNLEAPKPAMGHTERFSPAMLLPLDHQPVDIRI